MLIPTEVTRYLSLLLGGLSHSHYFTQVTTYGDESTTNNIILKIRCRNRVRGEPRENTTDAVEAAVKSRRVGIVPCFSSVISEEQPLGYITDASGDGVGAMVEH